MVPNWFYFVRIDGNKVDIASVVVMPGQKITLSEKGQKNQIYLQAKQSPRLAEVPDFLRREGEGSSEVAVVQSLPGIETVPFTFDAGLFTEYYAARNV